MNSFFTDNSLFWCLQLSRSLRAKTLDSSSVPYCIPDQNDRFLLGGFTYSERILWSSPWRTILSTYNFPFLKPQKYTPVWEVITQCQLTAGKHKLGQIYMAWLNVSVKLKAFPRLLPQRKFVHSQQRRIVLVRERGRGLFYKVPCWRSHCWEEVQKASILQD